MVYGYYEYKVAWCDPLVGEDILSEHEVRNLSSQCACCIVSCGQTTFFHFLYEDREILSPTQKKKEPVEFGNVRLHNVAIKKVIDDNLAVLGYVHSSTSISIFLLIKIIGGKNIGG